MPGSHVARAALLLVCCSPIWAAKQACAAPPPGTPQLWGFQVVAEYPHDPTAFTQGLVFDTRCYPDKDECKDVFYESTGMYGKSDVRVVHLETGAVEAAAPMAAKWFGEGLAARGGLLYQITWQGPSGFIYSARDLKPAGTFRTPLRDGWGVTNDGPLLVLSDGSAALTWVDPDGGWRQVRRVEVTAGGRPVKYLNELEMVDGEIWANVWQSECIARVDPKSGAVRGWVLVHGLAAAVAARGLPMKGKRMDVLNGIAWDAERRRLFVTGKYWPRLFEVTVHAVSPNSDAHKARAESCFVG